MHQTRRLAMAADPDGRFGTGGAPLAGDGGRHAVDDHDRQRFGSRTVRWAARSARSAADSGAGGPTPTTPDASLPAGTALAVGPVHSRPSPAAATPTHTRTLAGYSRTFGTRGTASESPCVSLHVKLYPQKTPGPSPVATGEGGNASPTASASLS